MENVAGTANPPTQAPASIDNEAWLSFWARRPLPILQSTKAALAGFVGKAETVQISNIVDVALKDPLLIAHCLRQINLRDRGSLAADIVSIENVILLMGVDNFLTEFSRLPTVESMLVPKHAAHYFALLREVAMSRLAARLARDFGVLRYDARLDEIFITALLANLPRTLRYIEVGLDAKVPAVDPASISLSLFNRWHLPEVFATLLDESGSASQRALLHQAALRLADRLQLGWWQEGISADIHIAAHTLSIEEEEVWRLVYDALFHFARKDWPYAQIFPPARWLPMLPGPWPKPQPKVTQPANPPEETAKVTLADILRELSRASDRAASFNQIMGLAIRGITEGIGLNRIMFGLLMAGQNALKTRYLVGCAQDDPLRDFHVELTAPHMFTRLMLKPQSIWLNETNKHQFESLLPRGLRQAIGPGDFVSMSLFVDDKPIGLFFADNRGAVLSEAQYNAFKQVCLATGQCLTRQARHLDLGANERKA